MREWEWARAWAWPRPRPRLRRPGRTRAMQWFSRIELDFESVFPIVHSLGGCLLVFGLCAYQVCVLTK